MVDGGASALPSNPEQGCTGKRKRINAGHLSDELKGSKKTCLFHGPGHSSEECKVLHEYTKKRSAQLTYKDNQGRYGGNKAAKQSSLRAPQKRWTPWNLMMNPSQERKMEKMQNKKSKSNQADADPSEDGRNYGLDCLNLWEPAQDSLSDSKWLLRQSGKIQRAKKRNNSIKRECDVLYNFINPNKRAKRKNSHYSPILQGCMNARSGKETFKNYQILLESGSSSNIVMGNLTPKLK